MSSSCIRRKPVVTYKSPTADDHAFIRSPTASTHSSSRKFSLTDSFSSSSSSSSSSVDPHVIVRRRYTLSPPLPLFHPFGALAMSLPPLDPTQYGLPIPSVPDDRYGRSGRYLKRPGPKFTTDGMVEDDAASMLTSTAGTTVTAIAAVAAREAKERAAASPRKRRAGGAKRKRRDADDGDAAYPAKRTRAPRGGAAVAASGGDDSGGDNNINAPGSEAQAANNGTSEALSETNSTNELDSKRRSTRSAKGSLKRRGSSASDNSSVYVPAQSILVGPEHPSEVGKAEERRTPAMAQEGSRKVEDDKEEGELSEENPSN